MPRPLDDLGPDFDRRWRQAPLARRREFIAELRDLYLMLEDDDEPLLQRLRNGSIPPPAAADADLPLLAPEPARPGQQGMLFEPAPAHPPAQPTRENPFLPLSILDRLQQSRDRASAGLRDLLQTTADDLRPPAAPPPGTATQVRLDDLERELRLKLGPVVETLIEANMEQIKSELRVRLRLEMDRLIAEHLRK